MNNFFKDEQKLLKTFLNSYLEVPLETQNLNANNDYVFSKKGLEIIIRPECNQTCEYCYIYKHGKELYPPEVRVSNEIILNNLKMLLNYYDQKKILFSRIEMFAGDLFYDNLYFDIVDIFYDYFYKIYQIFPEMFKDRNVVIMTPCNFSFTEHPDKVEKMIEYTQKFEKIKVDLALSWSSDGPYAVNIREKRELDNSYFDRIFELNNQLKFGIHPMVSAESIDVAIDNYDWWIEKYKEFDLMGYKKGVAEDFQPMLLEVRNDGWTNEKISKYLAFLKHMIEVRLEMCNNDIDSLARNLWYSNRDVKEKYPNDLPKMRSYDPIGLGLSHSFDDAADDRITCSMQSLLIVRLADLTLPICHRMTYPQFIGGKYVVENNEIVDIEPNNVGTYISAKSMKANCAPKCMTCHANELCLKGCLGSQYEVSGELVMPIESVCNLEKAKIAYLAKTYCEMGVIKSAIKQEILDNDTKFYILKFCERMGYKYE